MVVFPAAVLPVMIKNSPGETEKSMSSRTTLPLGYDLVTCIKSINGLYVIYMDPHFREDDVYVILVMERLELQLWLYLHPLASLPFDP